MSLSTTDSRFVYDGDGTTTEFSFPRKIIEAAHLDVWLYDEDDDSYALQTLNTHYTFAGSGLSNGIYASATVTFTTAPGSDKKVVLYRDPSLVQEADFSGETNVLNALNRFADRVTMQMQRMQDQIDRTIKLPDGDYAPSWGNTGTKADYANALLGFDSSGAPMPSVGSSGDVAISPAMTPVVQAGTLELASEAFGIMEVWAEWFGASPSASASTNAVALQAWIDRCAATGKIGRIGPGVFLVNATLIMKDGARIRGSGHFNWARTNYAYTDVNPTVIKSDGTITGTNSVVFRCSQMPVGVRGNDFTAPDTSDLQNIEVSDFHFDANGAALAAYYYRCGNESGVYRVSHSGAVVAGAQLVGLFTARGWHLSSMQNAGHGFIIGRDTSDTNLTDEAACNAVDMTLIASKNGGHGIDGKIARGSYVRVVAERNVGRPLVVRGGADAGGGTWDVQYTEVNAGGGVLVDEYDGNNIAHTTIILGYRHRGIGTIVQIPAEWGTGAKTVYTVPNAAGIEPDALFVYLNGVRQTVTTHYTLADNGADLDVTFLAAPTTGQLVAIHGNMDDIALPSDITSRYPDTLEIKSSTTNGGPSEPDNWLRIKGASASLINSLINSNTYRFILEGDGRTDQATQLQFIYKRPARLKPYVLAQSAVASAPVTGTTAETTLATVRVPAHSLLPNGRLRITGVFTVTSSTNAKTLRVKFAGGTYHNIQTTTTGVISSRFEVIVANVNSESSQKSAGGGNGALGFSSSALVTSSNNTAVDQFVTFTGILGDGSEQIVLESYCVEVLPAL
ncbi:MAG: hypothetical protein BroJett013_07420 [Alphaproteobacteria bacterium]|nr:MAG: hypothetical protein BroJett013_07420 [Alphaproteobacteria bacterium]